MTLELKTASSDNNRIPLGVNGEMTFTVSQPVDSIQWRSNHLRDDWSNLHSYEHTNTVTLDFDTVKHQLEHLPGKTLPGNHTLSMRAIEGESSSTLISFDIVLNCKEDPCEDSDNVAMEDASQSAIIVAGTSIFILVIVAILVVGIVQEKREQEKLRVNSSQEGHSNAAFDDNVDSVVDAELVE